MTHRFRAAVAATFGLAALSASTAAQAREISFSGYTWSIKDSSGAAVGPGPNVFSSSTSNVWVDNEGMLHLKIAKQGSKWACAEVIAQVSFGYGTYRVTYQSRVDAIDPQAVLAMFTWSDNAAYHNREIDIELSRWGITANKNAQFVVQPGAPHRWQLPADTLTRHAFTWSQTAVSFLSDASGQSLASWKYTGSNVPRAGGENPHLNLWLYQGLAPRQGQPIEVVISKFEWLPP